ncbi:MAG TPA: CocE/NonD family hydrolase [Actinomycetota bacterium]|nr:CocE/NonD family hydrolase [Actinomycetota bacterium]
MRRNAITALALISALAATVLPAAQAPAAPAKKTYTISMVPTVVPTRDGDIYSEIAHPVDAKGKIVKGPVILTYSPYSVLGRESGRDRWVPKGYHVVFADVVGTGNSGGCYDYGGDREKRTAHDLVEWLAKQKWSTGKVGMIGASYNGTTQHAAAVMHPKGLTTIIPEAAIARWYDYAFSGGIRYNLQNENPADEGVDTPLLFDFGFAIPPPVDVEDPSWADRVASSVTPCDELTHTEHGYDQTPDYDEFWIERDYERLAHKVKIPVLVSHNWGDWNVKQANGWDMFKAYPNAKMFFGDRWTGHGTPDGKYDQVVDKWFDHYLMGIDNGIEKLPKITSETSNWDGALKYLSANKVKTTPVKLYAQKTPRTDPNDYDSKLLPTKPITGLMAFDDPEFPSTSINTESHSNHHSRTNHDWWWFESPALKKDTRIFGEIKVKAYLETRREWITLTPTIVDIDMACHIIEAGQHVGSNPECLPNAVYSVTRGFLDTRYRDGLEKQVPIKPGVPFKATIVEKPQDYVFKKGHHIGLNFSTEINEWMIPKPYACADTDPLGCVNLKIRVSEGLTQVILPIVGKVKNPNDLFDYGHQH